MWETKGADFRLKAYSQMCKKLYWFHAHFQVEKSLNYCEILLFTGIIKVTRECLNWFKYEVHGCSKKSILSFKGRPGRTTSEANLNQHRLYWLE